MMHTYHLVIAFLQPDSPRNAAHASLGKDCGAGSECIALLVQVAHERIHLMLACIQD